MKSLTSIAVLLTVLQLSSHVKVCLSDTIDTKVNDFFTTHQEDFLALMKFNFNKSLNSLFASNHFGGQQQQQPGMAKLLKDQSDKHWNEGVDFLRKYLQRGCTTYADTNNTFVEQFNFVGQNGADNKSYLKQLKSLVDNSVWYYKKLNELNRVNHQEVSFDAEIGHYLEEKLEDEIKSTRRFSTMFTNLKGMHKIGMAVHFFDQSL